MRQLSKKIVSKVCLYEKLELEDQEMLAMALEARKKAQAPYSHYFVGVALKSESGRFYWGCNVERASYSQTTHAEQSAVDSMVAMEGPSKIAKLALIGAPEGRAIELPPIMDGEKLKSVDKVSVPCGHCLQIIWENCFGDKNVPILSLCGNGEISITTIDSAFPIKFGPADLGIDIKR